MRVKRSVKVLFVAVCVVWYAFKTFIEQRPWGNDSDFTWYYMAAHQIWNGKFPFFAGGYIYPPLLAFMVCPLALFAYPVAQWIWHSLLFMCLSAAGYLLWQYAGRGWDSACVVAAVWAFGCAAEDSLGLGQCGCLLTFFVTLAYTTRGWLRSSSIAVGFGIKLFPAIVSQVFLFRREWGEFRNVVLLGGAIIVLSWVPLFALGGPMRPRRVKKLEQPVNQKPAMMDA